MRTDAPSNLPQVEEEATEARRKAKDAADAVIKRAQEELQQRQDVEDQAQREVKSAQIALEEVRKQAKQEVDRAEEEAQQFFSKFKTQGEHSGAQVLVCTGSCCTRREALASLPIHSFYYYDLA